MAITTTTNVKFRFISAADFAAKVSASALDAGSLYFAGSTIYLATAANTYEIYGGVQVRTAPAIANAVPGVFYYDPTSGTIKTAVKMTGGTNAGTIQYITLTDSFADVHVDAATGNLVFTQMDGTEVTLTLPKTTTVNTTAPSDAKIPTEKAVVDYVSAQIGAVVSGVVPQGSIASQADVASKITAPKSNDMWRVGANFTSTTLQTDTGVSLALHKGDWVVFKTDATAPFRQGTHFEVYDGVENAAIDALDSTDTVLPLSANQGNVLDIKIAAKLDKFAANAANAGKLVTALADGSIETSGAALSTGTLPAAASASATRIISEKQAADALALKSNALGTGTADTIVTATAAGGATGLQRTSKTLSAASTIPAAGTASANAIPSEAAVRASLDAVSASAVINWLTD